MPNRRPWTEDDIAKLKSMVSAGASAVRVSLALKRPIAAVKNRARDLGMPFRHDLELKRERGRLLGTTTRSGG